MTLYMSPVVDVNEIDLTTLPEAVATSIGVTVLRNTYKGPEMKKTLITNEDELIETFGEPTSAANSYKDTLNARGFLLNGTQLYCTRVMPDTATFAGAYGYASGATTFTKYTQANGYVLSDFSSEDPDDFGDEVNFGSTPESGVANCNMAFIAASRGKWGSSNAHERVKVAVIGKAEYDTVTESTSAGDTNLTSELWEDVRDSDFFLEADMASASVSASSEFVVIVKVKPQNKEEDSDYVVVERWHVSTKENKLDDTGQSMFCERKINDNSLYIRIAISNALKEQDISGVYTADYQAFGGGSDAVTDTTLDTAIMNSFDLYDNPEQIDVNIFIDSDKSVTVKQYIIDICESRLDAVATLDPPSSDVINQTGNEVENLRDWRLNTLGENSSYGALYGNWAEVYDKWAKRYRWIPISGHVAGIYAYTDDVAEPWFAPAGPNRGILDGIRRLAWNPTKAQRDILYKNGINPIVTFAGQGKMVYGQKNLLQKTSAFNRVNVRRLFIVMEKALSTATHNFLFEPNDEFTRLQLLNMIDPYLRDIEARRGIYDFEVVCDERNNTTERIDRNELWCDIYIQPTRAAEYIVLNFIATRTGASFSELQLATTT